MSAPFRRPVLATLFYVFAGILGVLSVLSVLLVAGFLSPHLPLGWLIAYGAYSILILSCQALVCVVIGYVITLLAKIEWNTRTEKRWAAPPLPLHASDGKEFYLVEGGRTLGPLSGPALLNLYRDGKLSKDSKIYVEENHQRRLIRNWSEFGL